MFTTSILCQLIILTHCKYWLLPPSHSSLLLIRLVSCFQLVFTLTIRFHVCLCSMFAMGFNSKCGPKFSNDWTRRRERMRDGDQCSTFWPCFPSVNICRSLVLLEFVSHTALRFITVQLVNYSLPSLNEQETIHPTHNQICLWIWSITNGTWKCSTSPPSSDETN